MATDPVVRSLQAECAMRAGDNIKLHGQIDGLNAEVERLKAELDKAQTQRDAMFHEVETLRGKGNVSLVDYQLAEITKAHDRLKAENERLRDRNEAQKYALASAGGGGQRLAYTKKLLAQNDRLRRAGDALAADAKREHYQCDDSWYSCPASGDCANDNAGHECDCGKDQADALIAAWREAAKEGA